MSWRAWRFRAAHRYRWLSLRDAARYVVRLGAGIEVVEAVCVRGRCHHGLPKRGRSGVWVGGSCGRPDFVAVGCRELARWNTTRCSYALAR